MADDIALVPQHEDLQTLIERAEAAGVLETAELTEAIDALELEPADVEQLATRAGGARDRGGQPKEAGPGARRRPGRAGAARDDDRTPCSSSCARSGAIRC